MSVSPNMLKKNLLFVFLLLATSASYEGNSLPSSLKPDELKNQNPKSKDFFFEDNHSSDFRINPLVPPEVIRNLPKHDYQVDPYAGYVKKDPLHNVPPTDGEPISMKSDRMPNINPTLPSFYSSSGFKEGYDVLGRSKRARVRGNFDPESFYSEGRLGSFENLPN